MLIVVGGLFEKVCLKVVAAGLRVQVGCVMNVVLKGSRDTALYLRSSHPGWLRHVYVICNRVAAAVATGRRTEWVRWRECSQHMLYQDVYQFAGATLLRLVDQRVCLAG